MNKAAIIESFKKYDFSFFGAITAIFVIGIINLYSATHASSDALLNDLYKTQLMWFGISLFVGFIISFIHLKTVFRYSYFFYFLMIGILCLVLVLGTRGMGATRWLVIAGPIRFQPSEFMKVALVLCLARWYSRTDPEIPLGLKNLIVPGMLVGLPALLVIVQPDLGTGILLLLIFFSVSFYRNLKWKTIILIGILGIVAGTFTYEFGLKDYQRKRIITFLDPSSDAKGSGYNAIQSKIAIGSGQYFGKGFKKSSQASLNYLPENHTDFIFSIFNEEHGFFGSVVLIFLYLVLFYRFLWLATSVTKIYESIVTMGLMSIFFWHAFVNMAMVTGLLPIVGIPLPLMSYGGSSLLTFGICCGLATSMSNSRNLF